MSSQQRSHFQELLLELKEIGLEISHKVSESFLDAMFSLKTGNKFQAEKAIRLEQEITHRCQELEEKALEVLTLQQPVVTRDLRFVSTLLFFAREFERMGDYAKNIGQIALDLHNECPFTPNEIEIVDRLVEMNNFALDQLKKAREAFKNNDIGAVAPIVKQDIEINRMFDEAHLLILKLPFSGKQLTNRALLLSRVAHNLERLGDRIVFFTKRIVFIEKGELVNY